MSTPLPEPAKKLKELIGEYWDVAYCEGKNNEGRGDEAQDTLHQINEAIKAYAADETKRLTNTLSTYTEALQVVTAERDAEIKLLCKLVNAKHSKMIDLENGVDVQRKVLEQAEAALQRLTAPFSQTDPQPWRDARRDASETITAIQGVLK